MTIEIEFNSVMVRQDQIEELFPNLISTYLPIQKTPKKRRPRRKKKKVAALIDDIIDSIK